MKTMALTLTIMLLSALLGGCSVFGVATKGELEELERRDDAEERALTQRIAALDDRLARIDQNLTTIEQGLDDRIAGLESEAQRLDQDLTASKNQLLEINTALRAEFAQIRGDVQITLTDLQEARRDIEVAASTASRASADSRQALELQYSTLQDERSRLAQRLGRIDEVIASWQSLPPEQVEAVAQNPVVPELSDDPAESDKPAESGEPAESGKIVIKPASN